MPVIDRFAAANHAEDWWLLPVAMLFVLGAASVWDAFKGRVPDAILFPALLATAAVQGVYAGWTPAAQNLGLGLGAAFAVWGLNQIYYTLMGKDALGMGDAKWTALAVANFGLMPALFAWAVGAWLGLGWMGGLALSRRVRRLYGVNEEKANGMIHFTPFLFVGLIVGIYWRFLR